MKIKLYFIKVCLLTVFFTSLAFAGNSLPDTGQTWCYDSSWSVVDCILGDQCGQDGCYDGNVPDFETVCDFYEHTGETICVSGDDQVYLIDNNTGLWWMKTTGGEFMSFDEAVQYCDSLILGEHDDWRVPEIYELETITNYGMSEYAIDMDVFDMPSVENDDYQPPSGRSLKRKPLPESRPQAKFFSNTSSSDEVGWLVIANTGAIDFFYSNNVASSSYNKFYVRCVRGKKLSRGNFIDNGDGTISDPDNGLMWLKEVSQEYTWDDAMNYCQSLDFAGHSDWRLPNIRELSTNVDYTSGSGAPLYDVFAKKYNDLWSSTTVISQPEMAWIINSFGGFHEFSAKQESWNVARCVRDIEESNSPICMAPAPQPPAAPKLSIFLDGLDVTASWNAVDGAMGYILSAAPYPFEGKDTISTFDMGTDTEVSATLWPGAAYYIAVQSYNNFGTSDYSNVELINFPLTVW